MSDLICQKCGSKNPAWYADNDLFNKVNGSPDGVLCPMCFQELADSKGRNIIFKAEDMAKDDQSEIQRLTKEVEELTIRARHAEKQLLRDVKKVWDEGADKRELTRLRELLGKCRDSLSGTVVNLGFDSPMDHQIAEQLIDEIDNALNHKP